MDFDISLIGSLVREGKELVRACKAAGISPTDLQTSESKAALTFLFEYVDKYEEMPSIELLQTKSGLTSISPPLGTASYFIDELGNRKLYQFLERGLRDTINTLEVQNRPRDAMEQLEVLTKGARASMSSLNPVISFFSLGPQVLDFYEGVKSGKRGILTRWPTLNDTTMGLQPEDLVVVVARTNVGKTWTSIIVTHDAWAGRSASFLNETIVYKEDGKKYKVLYVTTEVSNLSIGARFYATRYNLPYFQLRSGRLDGFREKKFRAGVADLLQQEGLFILQGAFNLTVAAIAAAMDQAEPDLVVVDGAYLLKGDGKDRFDRAAGVFNDLKSLLQRTKAAGVVTTQLNRASVNPQQQGKGDPGTETIALSDVIGWNADAIFGMVQGEDLRRQRRMGIIPMKVREASMSKFEINWNFDEMNFDELPKPIDGGVPPPKLPTSKAGSSDATFDEDKDLPF